MFTRVSGTGDDENWYLLDHLVKFTFLNSFHRGDKRIGLIRHKPINNVQILPLVGLLMLQVC